MTCNLCGLPLGAANNNLGVCGCCLGIATYTGHDDDIVPLVQSWLKYLQQSGSASAISYAPQTYSDIIAHVRANYRRLAERGAART